MSDVRNSDSSGDLLPHHREHLRETSGLSDETLERAGVVSITDGAEAKKALGWTGSNSPPVPAIKFPFPGSDFCQLRPDKPREKDGKAVKYETPRGRSTDIYIPSEALCPTIRDHKEPLILTEGVKKALAGCQAGIPVVAATGIDNFHRADLTDPDARWQLKESLQALVADRDCGIAFDSDIDTKPQIAKAAVRLASMLEAAKGRPRITYIEQVGD